MAGKSISFRMSLEGSEAVNRQLQSVGNTGAKAVKQIQDAASGGSFASATASISKLGSTAEQAFAAAGAAAQKFGASTSELRKVDSLIQAIADRSRASGSSFVALAAASDVARGVLGGTGQAAANVGVGLGRARVAAAETAAAVGQLGTSVSITSRELKLLSQVARVTGAGGLGQMVSFVGGAGLKIGALAAAIAGLAAGGATLFSFAKGAAEAAAKLDAVAKAGNVSFEFLSSLQGAFARGGTSLDQFTQEFGNLSGKILEARTQLAQMRAGPEATQAANDIGNLTTKFRNLAEGIPQTFSPLTTLESKVKAVTDAVSGARVLGPFGQQLAQTVEQSEAAFLRLADVFKNLSSDMERAQLGKALGLSPQTIATLNLGAAAIRQMQTDIKQLGLSLSNLDKQNLAGVTAATARLGSLWDALKEKMGAVAAPAFTSFLEGLTSSLQQASPELQKLAQSFGQIDFSALGRKLGEAGVAVARFFTDLASQLAGSGGLQGSINQLGTTLAPTATQVGIAIGQGVVDGILNAVSAGMASLADTAGRYLKILPQLVVAELIANARILKANFASLLSGTPVQPPDLSDINAATEKLKQDAGLAGKQVANSIGQGAQTGVNQASLAVSNLGGDLNSFANQASQGFNQAWQKLAQGAAPVASAIKSVSTATQTISPVPVNTVTQALNQTTTAATEATGAIEEMTRTGAGATLRTIAERETVTAALNRLKEAALVANLDVTKLLQTFPAGAPQAVTAIDSVTAKLRQLMQQANDVTNAVVRMGGALVDASGPGFGTEGVGSGTAGIGSGYAGGGLLGGRGTSTSDSNLAWVSRGEHIMPARAVRQPGVLAFLEALRRSGGDLSRILDGMGRFALGGMVPRQMAIPAFANGGPVGSMSNVTIQFPGVPPISGLRASSEVVDQLHKAAALAQVRSGGRKPSRYS